jgi:hypothetical protein
VNNATFAAMLHLAKRRRQFLAALAGLSNLLVSCTSYQAVTDTHNTREFLTNDLEDQILLNLIRSKNGLPFSHYDVVNLQSNVLTKVNPSAMAGRTGITNSRPAITTFQRTTGGSSAGTVLTNTIGGASAVAEAVTRPLSASLSAENDNTITISVSPVHDEPAVYSAYVEFLNFGNDGDLGSHDQSKSNPSKSISSLSGKNIYLDLQTNTTTTSTMALVTGQPVLDKNGRPSFDTSGKPIYEPNSIHEVPTTTDETVYAPEEKSTDLTVKGFFEHVKSVAEGPKKPPEGSYIPRTVKYWEGMYYWIPRRYVAQFSKLCFSLVSRKASTAGAATGAGSTSIKNPVKLQQLQNLQLLNLNNAIQ